MIYNLDDNLEFGKHRGRKLNDIICGEGANSILIANFLEKCFDFFSKKIEKHNLWASDYLVDKNHYNSFSRTGITLQNEYTYFKNVQVENGLIFLSGDPEINKQLPDIIIPFLKSDFEPKVIISYTKNYNLTIISECVRVRPDYDYIVWAINNVDNFVISKDAINALFNCNSLRSFEIIPFDINKYKSFDTHLNFVGYKTGDIIIEYKPIFRQYEYRFSSQIIDINNEKLSRLSNKSTIYPPNDHPNKYTKYNGAEINGTWWDDFTIDNAFEGDPNNIWNID